MHLDCAVPLGPQFCLGKSMSVVGPNQFSVLKPSSHPVLKSLWTSQAWHAGAGCWVGLSVRGASGCGVTGAIFSADGPTMSSPHITGTLTTAIMHSRAVHSLVPSHLAQFLALHAKVQLAIAAALRFRDSKGTLVPERRGSR